MQIPTYKEIYDSIVSDIEAEFGIALPSFGKNYLRTLAAVQAAKIWLLYSVAAKLQNNLFPDTAEPESQGGTLERFGRVKLGRNPFPAKAGEYEIEVTGQSGTTITAGTTWQADDSATNPGINYVLDTSVTLSGSGVVSQNITVRALTLGTSGRQRPGDTITLTSPIALIEDTANVQSELTTPVESETIEQYRKETLQAFRLEPQGGAAADFRLWSLDANGVRTSYPFTVVGDPADTNVKVWVEALPANTAAGALQGTAPQSMLDEVEDVIRKDPDTSKTDVQRGRLPITAFKLDVVSVDVLEVEITINGFDDPGNNQSAIETAIEERLYRTRPFVAGIDPVRERSDVININNIIFEIQNINPRIRLNTVDLKVGGVSQADGAYQFGIDQTNGSKGEIPVLKDVIFN
jgi:uncharacterized phage protein gp47/JayE